MREKIHRITILLAYWANAAYFIAGAFNKDQYGMIVSMGAMVMITGFTVLRQGRKD